MLPKKLEPLGNFVKYLDEKCIASRKGYSEWLRYAVQNRWIKDEV
jgi:hypothetical protein